MKETREGIFDNEDNIYPDDNGEKYKTYQNDDNQLFKTVKQNETTIKTKYLYKTK